LIGDHGFYGEKLTIFRELAENEPENTFLMPVKTVFPTKTTVRMRA
jgi:hypothetical protein